MRATILGQIGPSPTFLQYVDTRVPAGFPSPAADYEEVTLSIDELIDLRTPHVYLVRVEGPSMIGAGIYNGDVLVVNKALEARSGHIVVAYVDGGMTVKRLQITPAGVWLQPENPDYRAIPVTESLHVWGVATHNLHQLCSR
ncbi:translesion error-prone DNA polymerase V autoproteolytic subunit [Pseudomonas sp. NP21570]|jgi:DNA polymerase V|uniref:Translesion error-prone DNA polymerase V autoproteolytic subunit n=1 Tax=Stutzerimonas kunmingensis TaxID=1211807 RepID=A0A9X1SQC0_9GAMM|nr:MULTISPECIES: translesion error-prone DNA polymerase V autoproteolytic subunit [Stutzerimonas stutzeri subgroup]MCB4796960.1 translesion error-prone DNA polymerase V autoproteolytic subunit [Pseudomonas sp. NP21570]MCD1609805.1 translesion error-prone DNA polymerase V autoproteolytic subunit [Stutzerimonas kunmingensis]MCQ4228511.1 translesion error-prone DNA polymerase V autoproteolytic subunit [Stutzerimonas stutzeri]OWG35995.1 umuDC operon-like protein [Stutzerimonas stutzeri]